MKKLNHLSVAVALATTVLHVTAGTALARDIEMDRARVIDGSVSLVGNVKVDGETRVLWEGNDIGSTTSKGRFSLTTTVLPQDCVGNLKIGSFSRDVVLRFCGPKGADGDDAEFIIKIATDCALSQAEICAQRPPNFHKNPVYPNLSTEQLSICNSGSSGDNTQSIAIAFCGR